MDRLVKHFRQFAEDDTLSHSYLFFGGEENAMLAFAKQLAGHLETGVFEISTRPLNDALVIDVGAHGTTSIDAVRGLKGFLASRPAVGKRRVAIISRAETLTPEAQNALLKIAEEPPAKALLILVARSAEGLVATLLSRLQKIPFESQNETIPRASALAKEFLRNTPEKRSVLIKTMLEDSENTGEAVSALLDGLILELYKDMPSSYRKVGFLLKRKKLMEELNINPRLQLEAISKIV